MTSYFASVDDNIATDATAGVVKNISLLKTLVSFPSILRSLRLWITINPGFGKTGHELFCIFARFESIG
jgi:hypothetical protein